MIKTGFHKISQHDGNPFAALPSLHTGWTWYAALFAVKMFGWRKAGWSFIFPIMIMLSIVYGAEHYVIDIIAGILVSTLAFIIVNHSKQNESNTN
jgi:membrane-associated phospholipid phosphatase